MRRLLLALFLVASLPLARAASHAKAPVIEVPNADNRADQLAKHYVVLVSIDGFRYDYAKLYGAPHLDAIAKDGAAALDGMLPSYPSTTFPNHYTIVTGLYPEHHGIVAMSFYDPARKERYSFNDPKSDTDGSWYRGVPLWSLAEKQGMRAACFFWPGSEAEIAGERPSYYLKYDDALPDEERVDQVVDWLKLPEAKRPHFITLYFGEVDHAGHEYGPDATQTRAAVRHVDGEIGVLRAKLEKLHLPIDLVVVSDHGMAKEEGGWIDLDQYADFSGVETVGHADVSGFGCRRGEALCEAPHRERQVQGVSPQQDAGGAELHGRSADRRSGHRSDGSVCDPSARAGRSGAESAAQ